MDEILGREEALTAIKDAMVRRRRSNSLTGATVASPDCLCTRATIACSINAAAASSHFMCLPRSSTGKTLCPSAGGVADVCSGGWHPAGLVSRQLCPQEGEVTSHAMRHVHGHAAGPGVLAALQCVQHVNGDLGQCLFSTSLSVRKGIDRLHQQLCDTIKLLVCCIWRLACQTGLTYLTIAFSASSVCIHTKYFSYNATRRGARTNGGPRPNTLFSLV